MPLVLEIQFTTSPSSGSSRKWGRKKRKRRKRKERKEGEREILDSFERGSIPFVSVKGKKCIFLILLFN